ncbi:NUDIX hydrolase [Microbacterium alcoholitolerans]|uniref:NUDIX hydrolase n=1 Tax=unclassified Microbacterium TaxID=2609290 RepID=UPI003D1803A4
MSTSQHPAPDRPSGSESVRTGIRVAGTAVVLRDGREGLETLLLRRPSTGSFAGAWVFPGGRVDPADRAGADAESDAARNAAVRETAEEVGIRVHSLTSLSCWVPPAETPVKFRTWFFLAREQGDEIRVNVGEIEDATWITPERAFEKHASGELTLFPPTWVTLHGLLAHRTVDEAMDGIREPARFETRMLPTAAGMRAMWLGDEDYPDARGAVGARHRLTMDTLPWLYERS